MHPLFVYNQPMVQSVLAVLLFGMVPIGSQSPSLALDKAFLEVAAPSPLVGKFPEALRHRTLTASGVTIVDLESAQMLFSVNPDERRPIASLTKLMTAVVIEERRDLAEWVVVPKGVTAIQGNAVRLIPGQHFRVGDLLTAMLVSSSNDAAFALALHHSGSEEAFAKLMNERAAALGLDHTSFVNAMGFDNPAQLSTPRDVAHLATFALKKNALRERMSLSHASIRSREGTEVALEQTHQLLKTKSAVVAGKTGTTDAAGQCLMSVVRERDRDYLVVILSSSERYRDMRVLLSVFANLLT